MNLQAKDSRPSLFEDLRGLPRSYWVLCVGTFINRFGTFVFPFLTLYLTSRLPIRPVLALGYLLIGFSFALNIIGPTAAVMIAAIGVFTLGEMLCLPVSGAYLANLAPKTMRGRYMGAFGLSWALATTTGPLGLKLYDLSPNILWLATGVIGAAGAVIILALGGTIAPQQNGIDSAGQESSI